MHNIHAAKPVPKCFWVNHIPFNGEAKTRPSPERKKNMIILSVLRGVAAFFAALPGAVAEAQKLRREYHRRHPFMEF
jgi:hypothetical protein